MVKHRAIKFESRFDQPIEAVWSIFGDTERLNQATGTPWTPYTAEDVLQADGTVIRHAQGRAGPFLFRWREGFGEWVEGRHLRQERHFENGPFKELSLDIRLSADGEGTRADYVFDARWTSLLGHFLSAVGLLRPFTRPIVKNLEKFVAELDQPADGAEAVVIKKLLDAQPENVRTRLDAAVARIEKSDHGHGLIRRLADHLSTANVLDLRRIRPLALAVEWNVPPRHAIEMCLAAHTAGILQMRWEIMCPRCRGGKSKSGSLAELEDTIHCDACNIDYERDFSNNVELVFSPEAWLRDMPKGDFCMMGPVSTPHVKVQCDVAAAGNRIEETTLPAGRYRLRTLETGGEAVLDHDGGAFPEVIVRADSVEIGAPAPAGQIAMRNEDDHRRCVVVETTAWSDLALSGPKVIANQAFRQLCPEQLLRPGDEISIGRVAILFSDLKGSTALYEEIGDSRAYVLVREHFEFLQQHVQARDGAVVKTIGDAVMAAFPEGSHALAAALDIQNDVASFNAGRGDAGISLKIGLHEGPCISVTTNGVLDYFGSSINLAARLQGQSQGGEIIISETVFSDPNVQTMLSGRVPVRELVDLSGFAEPIGCYRLMPG